MMWGSSIFFICAESSFREDLEDDEYEDTKNETLEQLKEFNESLNRMKEGDLSLVDDLNSVQLVCKISMIDTYRLLVY